MTGIGFGAAAALWWAALVLIMRASFGVEPGVVAWLHAGAAVGLGFGIGARSGREKGRFGPLFGSLITAAILHGTGGWGGAGLVISVSALLVTGAMIGRRAAPVLPSALIGAGIALVAAPSILGYAGVWGCLFAGAVLMALFHVGDAKRSPGAGSVADRGDDSGRVYGPGAAEAPGASPGSGRIAFLLAGAGVALLATVGSRIADLTAGGTLTFGLTHQGVVAAAFGIGALLTFDRRPRSRPLAGAALVLAAGAAWFLFQNHGELPWIFIEAVRDSLASYQSRRDEGLLVTALAAAPWALLTGLAAGFMGKRAGLRSFFIGLAVGAFVAAPVFANGGIKACALTGIQLIACGAGLFWLRSRGIAWKLAGLAAPAAAFLVAAPNLASWQGPLYATAPYRHASLYADQSRREFESEYVVIPSFYEEGLLWNTSVIAYPNSRQLRLDGVARCNDHWHAKLQMLMARVPLMFRPESERMLALGLGTGVIPGSAGEMGPGHVDVVEPEPAIVKAAERFHETNGRYLDDERVHLHRQDPRAFLSRVREPYDVIVTHPVAPWDRRTGHMITREYFEQAASALVPGGIYAHWLPLSGISLEAFRTQIRTFSSVFPYVVGIRAAENLGLILIGSAETLRVPYVAANELWRDPSMQTRIRALGAGDVHHLVYLLRLTPDNVASFAGEGPLDTDNRPRTEWDAAAALTDLAGDSFDERLRALHPDGTDLFDFEGATDQQITRFYWSVARAFRGADYPAPGYRYARLAYDREKSADNLMMYAFFVREVDGDLARSVALLEQAYASNPDNPLVLEMLGDEYLLARRYEDLEKFATELWDRGLPQYWIPMFRGIAKLETGRTQEAIDDLLVARERDRHQDTRGRISYHLAVAYHRIDEHATAGDYARATLGRNPRHKHARLLEAQTKVRLGTMSEARYAAEFEAPFNRVRASSLFTVVRDQYYELDRQPMVERDLAVIINSTPNHMGSYLLLARFYHDRGDKEKEGKVLSRMIAQFDANEAVLEAYEDYLMRTGGREKLREFAYVKERLLGSGG